MGLCRKAYALLGVILFASCASPPDASPTPAAIVLSPQPVLSIETDIPQDPSPRATSYPPTAQPSLPSQTAPPPPALAIPQRELSEQGPWLLVASWSSLTAFNSDGSGNTVLIQPGPVAFSVSPSGDAIAYTTDKIPEDDASGLQLRLFQLPSGPDKLIVELQNPDLLPASESDGYDAFFEAMRAIQMTPPLWSHSGAYVAFVGQQEGPSSDLYVYSTLDRTITRLSDGPSQAYSPSWSPDDRYIFHAGAWGFGTGAGYSNAGSWIVSRDGTRTIETTTGQGQDDVLAWQNDRRFLMVSWSQPCGSRNLRTFNIDTGEATDVWPYYFWGFHFVPSTGQLILSAPPDFVDCAAEPQPTGLLVFDDVGSPPHTVSPDGFHIIEPDPSVPGAFLLRGTTATSRLRLPDQIDVLPYALDARSEYSLQGHQWLWYESWADWSGVWIGDMLAEPRRVFAAPVSDATWTPDGKALFLLGKTDRLLYRAAAPTFDPQPVSMTTIFDESSDLQWAGR